MELFSSPGVTSTQELTRNLQSPGWQQGERQDMGERVLRALLAWPEAVDMGDPQRIHVW